MLSWIPTAYLLASAVLLLPFGRIADMHGRKRVFIAGMVVVMFASVLASAVRTLEQLVACRVLQGIGASMLFATGVALLSSLIPRERRGAAIGMTVSAVYSGLAFGPLIGGWVTHNLSWRAAFLVHVPLALLIIALALVGLRGEWRNEEPQRFDFIGAGVYACAVTTFMYGLSILPSAAGGVLLLAGAAAFLIFVRHERRVTDPLFDVSLFFSNRVFTYSCLASLILYTATFATSFLLSLYLQYVKSLSAESAGLILVSQPAVMALLTPFTGRMADRHEPRVLASAGLVLTASGLGLLSALAEATTHYYVVASLIIVGAGFALFSAPNVHAIMGSVDRQHYGSASGAVSTMRVLGQMSSMALVTVIFALFLGPVAIEPAVYPALIRSVDVSFLVAAFLSVAAIGFSLARGEVHGRKG
jgi:EmrB/QacA subfamily drug resistance transporter